MESNEYKPNEQGTPINNNNDSHNYNAPYDNQNDYQYYYNNGAPMYGSNSPRKSGGGKGILIAFLMVLCLAVGGLVTAFVIIPAIQPKDSGIARVEATPDSEQQAQQVVDNQDSAAVAEPQTTDNPSIGGQVPNIDASKNPIVQIAKEVGPAVVGVSVSVDGKQALGEDAVDRPSGYGTGIIISEDGYIVTNNHVIDNSDSVKVTLMDDREFPATVVGGDATTDIAVLKIDAAGLTVAAFGDSDQLLVGETVVAIGNPLGSDLAGSVTAGIVSALNREISTNGYSQKFIQTDAAINPGNSGGALVNEQGQVIGINTLKTYLAGYDDYGVPIGTEGIGFAIPINTARPIIEQLMRDGKVERPGIGISCLVDITNAYNPEGAPDGVTIVEVVKGGPGDQAGIKPNDIITSIEGKETKTVEELTNEIKSHKIGDELSITVWRDGKEYKATVTVGDLNNM